MYQGTTKTSELPHQQRVIEEQKELCLKVNNLHSFFQTPLYDSIDKDEQYRLGKQFIFMELYLGILNERINNF